MTTDYVIASACRTPIGAVWRRLQGPEAADLAAVAIREALARANATPASRGDVILGCVLQAGAGMNVARQAALKRRVPIEVPAETVNRVCGSGLQSWSTPRSALPRVTSNWSWPAAPNRCPARHSC